MTSVNASTKLSTTKFLWTNDRLIVSCIDHSGSMKTIEISDYLKLIKLIDSGLISGVGNIQITCAYAMVLAAKELDTFDNKYYSKLLKISLNIETINKTNLSSIVKRMLSAGDDANGPVNGKNVVVKKMILEANLIEKEKSV